MVAFYLLSDLGYEDTDQDNRESTNENVDEGEPTPAGEGSAEDPTSEENTTDGAAGGKVVGKSNGVVKKPSREREEPVRTGGATAQVRK